MASENNNRPDLSSALVTILARDLYGLHVQSVKELDSFEDRNYHIMVDVDKFNNDFIEEVCVHGYVLKVLNSEDSRHPDIIDARNAIIQHVHRKGIVAPLLTATIHGKLAVMCSYEEKDGQQCYEIATRTHTTQYAVRLFEYIPGTTLNTVHLTPRLSFEVGQHAALLDEALQDFDDSNCPNLYMKWALENVPSIRQFLYAVKDPKVKRVVSDVIDEFEARVLKSEDRQIFRTGITHNDLTVQNILVEAIEERRSGSPTCQSDQNRALTNDVHAQSSPSTFTPLQTSPDTSGPSPAEHKWKVCGFLDFSDLAKSYLMMELAIAMVRIMTACPEDGDPIQYLGHILAGYLSKMQLSKTEVQLLPLAACARFCQLLVYGSKLLAQDPLNEYVVKSVSTLSHNLLSLWATPQDIIFDTWKSVVSVWDVKYPE